MLAKHIRAVKLATAACVALATMLAAIGVMLAVSAVPFVWRLVRREPRPLPGQ